MIEHLVVVISSHEHDWGQLTGPSWDAENTIVYVDANNLKPLNAPPPAYDLVMIDGQNGRKSDLKQVIESNRVRPIQIAWHIHESGITKSEIEHVFKELNSSYPIRGFIHFEDRIWSAFQPIVDAICMGHIEHYKRSFQNLCCLIGGEDITKEKVCSKTGVTDALRRFVRHDLPKTVHGVKDAFRLTRDDWPMEKRWGSVRKALLLNKDLVKENIRTFEEIAGGIINFLPKRELTILRNTFKDADKSFDELFNSLKQYSEKNKSSVLFHADKTIGAIKEIIRVLEDIIR